MDYVSLRKEVIDAGLLDRQYGYYAFKMAFNFALLALCIFILATVDNFALQLLNAVFLAFVTTQFGFVMHDAVHDAVFKGKKRNMLLSFFTGGTMMQLSASSWGEKHNQHHSAPNHAEDDPDIRMPILAFTKEQALEKRGIAKLVVRYQAYAWLFIMLLPGFSMRLGSGKTLLENLFRKRTKDYLVESCFVAVGYVLYFGTIFYFLDGLKAWMFILVNYLFAGLYGGTTFATNHKGMPILGEKLDFLRSQVLTTRNVRGSLLTDLWCGGLNFQIEHHLFPTMPRNNFSKAQKIVKPFCREAGIEYYETGFFQSYREILQHLHSVSSVLRKPGVGSALASFASKA